MSFILNIFFPGLGFFRLKQYQLSLIYFCIAIFVIVIYPFSISLLHLLFDLNGLLLFCVFYLSLILYLISVVGLLYISIKFRVSKIKNVKNCFYSISTKKLFISNWIIYIFFISVWYFLIANFAYNGQFFPVKRYSIPAGSMVPTLLVGDVILAKNHTYLNQPQRGEIVLFKKPSQENIIYIKRLVGLPRDTIQLREGILYINEKKVKRVKTSIGIIKNRFGDEKTISQYNEKFENTNVYKIIENSDNDPFDNTVKFEVPEGHYFFLGDNRDNSRDSRSPDIGFVPISNIVGKTNTVLYSFKGSTELYEFWNWSKSMRIKRIGKQIN